MMMRIPAGLPVGSLALSAWRCSRPRRSPRSRGSTSSGARTCSAASRSAASGPTRSWSARSISPSIRRTRATRSSWTSTRRRRTPRARSSSRPTSTSSSRRIPRAATASCSSTSSTAGNKALLRHVQPGGVGAAIRRPRPISATPTCSSRATRWSWWAGSSTSAKGKGLVGFDAPIATDNGKPITGWVKMWFVSERAGAVVRVRRRRLQHRRVSAARSRQPAVSAHRARGDLRAVAADSARRVAVRAAGERQAVSRPQLDPR